MSRPMVAVLAVACLNGPALAQEPIARNLVRNSSFEDLIAGTPIGWRLEPGAAGAEWSVSEGSARSGLRCVKVVNHAARSPHVFGRLVTDVALEPGEAYTLSCYVKSADPGVAWLGTGKDWQFRYSAEPSPEWTRIVGTFVADAGSLQVMFVSESPTEGILIDDVQLVRGTVAPDYYYEGALQPGQGALEVHTTDIPQPGANLIPNPSFEQPEGGLPSGWRWDPRNTDATATLDYTVARSGRCSLRLTNGTDFGAHVYGMLTLAEPVQVKPSTSYTLSCFFRTIDDTIAWIGGGPDWLVRLRAPRGKSEWHRASLVFRTGPEQTSFELMAITESPTKGVWLDDAKLEEGAVATAFIPEGKESAPQINADIPSEVAIGTTLDLGATLWLPPALAPASLIARLGQPDGRTYVSLEGAAAVPEGVSVARLRYGVPEGAAGPCRLTLLLTAADGVEIAAQSFDFTLVTAHEQEQRLAALRARLPSYRDRLESLRAAGRDAAYALVQLTVLEQFSGFVEEDLSVAEVVRARQQLDEMDAVEGLLNHELSELEASSAELQVPRYVTSPIGIADGAFRARVRWPDGRFEEDWPVIFTGYGHFGAVKRDLELMPDYGMNIIQVEFGPNSVLPSEDTVSLDAVEEFIALLDRAAAANVAVNLLLSPHYAPQWMYDKWPEVGGVDGGFIRFSVDSPHTRSVHERFLRTAIPLLAGRPALHSFCLSNEPIYVNPSSDPENRRAYTRWLRERYGTVEAAAAAHGTAYRSFDEVPILPGAVEELTPRARYDYIRFNNDRFAGWHRWMADIVHEYAPDTPVHAKIMNTVFATQLQAWGVDPELFCALSQIAGNDCWKYYTHRQGQYANGWQGENMFFDLLRSIAGQPIYNSENHVIPDRDLEWVDPNHIRNIIWQSAIHGEGASTMWVWERTFDPGSDFAGSIMHRPACAEAHGRTGLDLLRLGREVNAFQTAPARVALVYSIASLVYSADSERILGRTYEALNFTGEKLDFITERQLAAGKASQYELVVAAGVTHLPADAYEGLRRYLADDGRVLTVGRGCLEKDDFDRPVDRALPGKVVGLEEKPARELRPELATVLDSLGAGRPIRVLGADSDEEPWGVEWLSTEHDGRVLVNLTNYLNEPVRLRLAGLPEGQRLELLSGEPVSDLIEIEPLGVRLIAAHR